jgi:hypothetical protein
MKRLLVLVALIAGAALASFPSDAMAGRWARAYRNGYAPMYYNGAYYNGGYRWTNRPRYYYGRPRVVVQTPGAQVGYGAGYYYSPYVW